MKPLDNFVNTEIYSLVVSRYKENIDWLLPFKNNCFIYEKGGMECPECPSAGIEWKTKIKLPNVGRESHTYLRHIIDNYETLSGIILFTQGDISDHLPESYKDYEINYLMKLISSASINGLSFNAYPHPVGNMSAHPGLKLADKWMNLADSSMNFGEWMNDIFDGNYTFNPAIRWYMNAIFAVDSTVIKKHPRWFYEKLISYVDDHKDPEAGHYFERAWYEIFNYNK